MNRPISILAFTLILAASAFGQARLVAPADRFDFGVVPTNTVLAHHFWLKSIGQDTVVIDTVKTGCSCAVTELEKTVLPPGDSVLLGITWDIGRSHGSIFRSPMVFYNGNDEALRVHMGGTIWTFPDSARPVSLKPHRFELSRASVKDVDRIEFTLINHSAEAVDVQLISLVPPQVELIVPDSVPANGIAKGTVTLLADRKNEEFSTSVTLAVGNRDPKRLTIPIRRKFY